MSQLVLDLQLGGEPVVADFPAQTSFGFIEPGENVKVISFQSIWEGPSKISKTRSRRKSFYTKMLVKFPFPGIEAGVEFSHIGSGANRVCYRSKGMVFKVSTVPLSRRNEQS